MHNSAERCLHHPKASIVILSWAVSQNEKKKQFVYVIYEFESRSESLKRANKVNLNRDYLGTEINSKTFFIQNIFELSREDSRSWPGKRN